MSCSVTWVRFTKRTDDPKLEYLERRLDAMGIPHRRNGHSFHAPILEVPEQHLEAAWAMLGAPVEYEGRTVSLDDVPDDAAMFAVTT